MKKVKKVNKFNIHWQVTRVKAKKIKGIKNKIDFILSFLNDNLSEENYARVENWFRMTKMGYHQDREIRNLLDKELNGFLVDVSEECWVEDNENDLSLFSDDDILAVYEDLSKRKYGFQFQYVPEAHINFLKKLESRLHNENVEGSTGISMS